MQLLKKIELETFFFALIFLTIFGGCIGYCSWHDNVKLPQKRLTAYESYLRNGAIPKFGSDELAFVKKRRRTEIEAILILDEIQKLKAKEKLILKDAHFRSDHWVSGHYRNGKWVSGHLRSASNVSKSYYFDLRNEIEILEEVGASILTILVDMRKGKWPKKNEIYDHRRSIAPNINWPSELFFTLQK